LAAKEGPESSKIDDKPPPLIFKARWVTKTEPNALDTIQLIKVVFKLKFVGKFGEGVRLVGGHETLGNWSLVNSIELTWAPGDVWVTPPLELPVDGIFVYKYVLCRDGNVKMPIQWQTGNNQVLALAAGDAPLLEVHDNWRGDPALAFTCSPDGTNSIQSEQRLLGRVRQADRQLQEAQHQIADLSERLKRARYEAKALREEAKIGANARLALKSQLAAERARANQLEAQVMKWEEEEQLAQMRLDAAVERCRTDAVGESSISDKAAGVSGESAETFNYACYVESQPEVTVPELSQDEDEEEKISEEEDPEVVDQPSAEAILEVEVVDPLTDPELVGMEGERQSFDVDDDEDDYSLQGPPKRQPTDRVDDLLSQLATTKKVPIRRADPPRERPSLAQMVARKEAEETKQRAAKDLEPKTQPVNIQGSVPSSVVEVLDEREALASPSPSGSEKTSAFEQVSSGLFGIFGGSENKKENPSGFNRGDGGFQKPNPARWWMKNKGE